MEARGPVTVARVATSPSSEGLIEWRGREASPGFGAPKLAFPTAVSGVVSAGLKPRYSGGTAPESHRLPEPATAVIQLSIANLRARPTRVKRACQRLLELIATLLVFRAHVARWLWLHLELGIE